MVRVFTTYFAKLRTLDNNLVPIAIVRYSPKWYDGKLYQTLAPKAETLLDYKYYSDGDWEKFKRKYLEQLKYQLLIFHFLYYLLLYHCK